MPPENTIDQVPVEDLTPEQASHIIHSHRKVRYGTRVLYVVLVTAPHPSSPRIVALLFALLAREQAGPVRFCTP